MSPEPVPQYSDYPQSEASTVRRLHTPSPSSPSDNAPRVADATHASEPATPPPVNGDEAARRAGTRKIILGGAAAGALVLGTIGYVIYPHRAPMPMGQEAGMTATSTNSAPSSRPQASRVPSAARPEDTRRSRQPAQTPSAAPGTDLNAMLAFGPKSASVPQPAPAPTAHDATVAAAVNKPTLTQTAPMLPTTASGVPHPTDAARDAARLVAAPMATQDQVDVLQLVTMEAALVQQDRAEVAALRAQMQQDRQAALQHEADLNRRLAMLEARKAVSDAAQAPQHARDDAANAAKRALAAAMGSQSPQPTVDGRAVDGRTSIPAQETPPPQPAPMPRRWVPHYRIVSASPLLAMVQDDNAPAGQPAQYEVQIGANLRGYGVVQSIYQSGTNWVIKTDHGQIL